jgi:hypothetical protein
MPTGYGLEMEWSLPPRSFRRQRFFVRHRRIDGTSYPGFGQPESVMVGQGGRPRHAASGRVRPLSGSTAGVTGASKAAVQGRSGSRGSPLVANGHAASVPAPVGATAGRSQSVPAFENSAFSLTQTCCREGLACLALSGPSRA